MSKKFLLYLRFDRLFVKMTRVWIVKEIVWFIQAQ